MDRRLNPAFVCISRIISGSELPDLTEFTEELIIFTEIQTRLQKLLENSKELPFEVILLLNHSFEMFLKAGHFVLVGERHLMMATLRIALEASLYAFDMKDDADTRSLWLKRHESEASKRACRKAFSGVVERVTRKIENDHVTGFSVNTKRLYDLAIDLGAHPNIGGILKNIDINVFDSVVLMTSAAFGSQSDTLKKSCMCSYIEFGCAITICWSIIFGSNTRNLEKIVVDWVEKARTLKVHVDALEKAYLEKVSHKLNIQS
jgi:hypothetical protein